jgi:hypothetical protein
MELSAYRLAKEVFALAFWVRIRQVDLSSCVLGQQAPEAEWLFQSHLHPEYFISPQHYGESDRIEHIVLTPNSWHHVAIARTPDGTSRIWVDGGLALEGRRSHPWPSRSRWLTVGSAVQGQDNAFHGAPRDLRAFERVHPQAKTSLPKLQIMMLTVFEDQDRIFQSLTAGASGYLLKQTQPAQLLEAVTELHRGGSPMSTQIARRVVEAFRHPALPRTRPLARFSRIARCSRGFGGPSSTRP